MTKQEPKPQAELKQILERLTYPKNREEIIENVRQAGHDDAVVNLITTIPADTYNSASAVEEALNVTE